MKLSSLHTQSASNASLSRTKSSPIIELKDIMAITKGDTVEAPRTKLPYYDLARHGADDPVPAASGFHQTTITASPVFASAPALLQAFAAFVSAVTDLQHVAFVAECPADNASEHQQRVLAIASVPGIDQPRQYASDHVHVSTFLEESLDAEVFEFEMQIRSASESSRAIQPTRVSPPRRSRADHGQKFF